MANWDDKLKSGLSAIWSEVKDVWNRGKMVILSILSLILFVKFRDILLSFLIAGGKKTMTKASSKDAKLSAEEVALVKQSDDLVAKAEKEGATPTTPTSDDWYKKP